MKISVYTLAQAIKVPRSRINDVVLGPRGITADTAFRLARYFGTSPDFVSACRRVTTKLQLIEKFAVASSGRSDYGLPEHATSRVSFCS